MTAFDYSGLKNTAESLISKFGKAGILLERGPNTGTDYDPLFGPDVEHPIVLVEIGYESSEIDGTLVKATDKRFIVSTKGLALEIDVKHRIRVSGDDYAVVTVNALNPGGTVLIYDVQARA